MTISSAKGLCVSDIRCPECKRVRTVDPRHARRWREGHEPGLCAKCRGASPTRVARDKDIRFWLNQYGVQVPRGQKARTVVTASGLPPDLADFARSCFPQ